MAAAVASSPMEFASIGKSFIDSQLEGESAAERDVVGGKIAPKVSSSRKFMVTVFLSLLVVLIIYQTFIQFFVKLIDNENVLKLIQTYLEKSEEELKSAQNKLSDLVCKMNASFVSCVFNQKKLLSK